VKLAPVPGSMGAGVSFGVAAAKALENGSIDGFWANGMGAEVAVRNGAGSLVIDARREDGPAGAQHYTFPALVTTQRRIDTEPATVMAAVRALVGAQHALKQDASRATEVGARLFPPAESELIAELIRRDAPYYDASITPETVEHLNAFARDMGLLTRDVGYQQVVATGCEALWRP